MSVREIEKTLLLLAVLAVLALAATACNSGSGGGVILTEPPSVCDDVVFPVLVHFTMPCGAVRCCNQEVAIHCAQLEHLADTRADFAFGACDKPQRPQEARGEAYGGGVSPPGQPSCAPPCDRPANS